MVGLLLHSSTVHVQKNSVFQNMVHFEMRFLIIMMQFSLCSFEYGFVIVLVKERIIFRFPGHEIPTGTASPTVLSLMTIIIPHCFCSRLYIDSYHNHMFHLHSFKKYSEPHEYS